MRMLAAAAVCGLMLIARPANAFPGKCFLKVDGRTYLNGTCNIVMLGNGNFSVGAGETSRSRYFAYVYMTDAPGSATARWNGNENDNHAERDLGTLIRQQGPQGCWANDHAKICAAR